MALDELVDGHGGWEMMGEDAYMLADGGNRAKEMVLLPIRFGACQALPQLGGDGFMCER